ncbi:hypothetical protein BaRGS_00024959 [Batillaria attramentaria]|uniref:Glutathione peroxidase n=1 Tax=Batillaria attramentaria TaxID=370345 RepID=A0ABD0K9K3_9CAEN
MPSFATQSAVGVTMGAINRSLTALCGLLALVVGPAAGQIKPCTQPASDQTSLYDFTMLDITKTKNISLGDYRGNVVLVVNVATY